MYDGEDDQPGNRPTEESAFHNLAIEALYQKIKIMRKDFLRVSKQFPRINTKKTMPTAG